MAREKIGDRGNIVTKESLFQHPFLPHLPMVDPALEESLWRVFSGSQLPEQILKNAESIGKFRKEYGSLRGVVLGRILLACLLWALFAFSLWGWIHLLSIGLQTSLVVILVLSGITVGSFVSGLYFFRVAIGNVKSRAFICDDGILLVKGVSTFSMRWDEVQVVQDCLVTSGFAISSLLTFASIFLVPMRQLTLFDDEGRSLTLTDAFYHLGKIANVVHKEVSSRQVPRMLDRLNAGESVSFGRLALSSDGISLDGKLLAWNKVQSVSPAIQIWQKGSWLIWGNIPRTEISNAQAFLELTGRILQAPNEATD